MLGIDPRRRSCIVIVLLGDKHVFAGSSNSTGPNRIDLRLQGPNTRPILRDRTDSIPSRSQSSPRRQEESSYATDNHCLWPFRSEEGRGEIARHHGEATTLDLRRRRSLYNKPETERQASPGSGVQLGARNPRLGNTNPRNSIFARRATAGRTVIKKRSEFQEKRNQLLPGELRPRVPDDSVSRFSLDNYTRSM